jgi:Flp pilus assembly protein TadD
VLVLLRGVARARDHLWEIALAVTAAGALAAQFFFYPKLGAPRDWDVLAVGAFPLAVVGAALLPRAWPALTPRIAPWLIGLAALHTLPWILVNAQADAARARYADLPISRGQHAFVLGARALREGDVDDAVAHFRTAVEVAPGSVHAWMSFGIALSRVDRPAEALAAYERALVCEPNDHRVSRADVLERLAEAALRAGATDRAENAWCEMIAERPLSVPARVGLATLALARGQPEAALASLEPIRSRRGAKTPAVFGITWQALRALGRQGEAEAILREGLSRFPDDPALRAAASSR